MPPTRRPGHQWMLSKPLYGQPVQSVDAEKGILRGVSIITEGEALGHGFHVDSEFIGDVVDQGNAKPNGVKIRFGHPTLSAESLGTFLGRAKNFSLAVRDDKAAAKADLFLSKEAKETPNGDLFGYVVRMAQSEPDAFGMSIVFDPGGYYQRDSGGEKLPLEDSYPAIKDQAVFIELKNLLGADCVDDPAANPNGLFSFGADAFAAEASAFLDEHPEFFELLDQHPDIVAPFLARYRSYLERKGTAMPEDLSAALQTDDAASEQASVSAGQTVQPAATADPETEPQKEPEPPVAASELPVVIVQAPVAPGQRFLDAFGDLGGRWFAEGKTFEEAQALYCADLAGRCEKLRTENEELTLRIAQAALGTQPVSHSIASPPPDPEAQKRARREKQLGPAVAKLADKYQADLEA